MSKFSEADWNNATWCTAKSYNEEEDDDTFDHNVSSSENVNGYKHA